MKQEFISYGLPVWCMWLIGFVKVSLATILIIGIFQENLIFPAAIGMAILMFGAILMHLKVKDSLIKSSPAFIFLILSISIAFL